MQIVTGGGFTLITDDPVMIAVVRRCAELEARLAESRYRQDIARFRTLRRDVNTIKREVMREKP
jgi:hypothetical protein